MTSINTNYKPLRIHFFQHIFFEGPANIEAWCVEKGHLISFTKFYEDPALPELSDIDWLIIMGGPMSVYDGEKLNWLAAEKQFIKKAILAAKTIIGICLGAQLLAEILGAKVYQNNYKEIGWLPVALTSEGQRNNYFQILKTRLPFFIGMMILLIYPEMLFTSRNLKLVKTRHSSIIKKYWDFSFI